MRSRSMIDPTEAASDVLRERISHAGSIALRLYAGDELLLEFPVPADKVSVTEEGGVEISWEPRVRVLVGTAGGRPHLEFWLLDGDPTMISSQTFRHDVVRGDRMNLDLSSPRSVLCQISPRSYLGPPPGPWTRPSVA